MAVQWKTATNEEFEALPKTPGKAPDGEWGSIMGELAAGNPVQLDYGDDKERGTLARSVGRRAAHMGFKVEIRRGDGFLVVKKQGAQSEPAKARNRQGGK